MFFLLGPPTAAYDVEEKLLFLLLRLPALPVLLKLEFNKLLERRKTEEAVEDEDEEDATVDLSGSVSRFTSRSTELGVINLFLFALESNKASFFFLSSAKATYIYKCIVGKKMA